MSDRCEELAKEIVHELWRACQDYHKSHKWDTAGHAGALTNRLRDFKREIEDQEIQATITIPAKFYEGVIRDERKRIMREVEQLVKDAIKTRQGNQLLESGANVLIYPHDVERIVEGEEEDA